MDRGQSTVEQANAPAAGAMRRPAAVTQAKIERVMRAAKKEGVKAEIRPDGTIVVTPSTDQTTTPLETSKESVL
jgi:hypothetical protein